MKEISVTVVDPVGLHARPATVAVNAASKFKCDVTIAYMGRTVNMKSIMGVMSLGIPTQSDITIKCNECGAQSVLLENEFLCPKCGSNSLDVISGEDMYLMRLEME